MAATCFTEQLALGGFRLLSSSCLTSFRACQDEVASFLCVCLRDTTLDNSGQAVTACVAFHDCPGKLSSQIIQIMLMLTVGQHRMEQAASHGSVLHSWLLHRRLRKTGQQRLRRGLLSFLSHTEPLQSHSSHSHFDIIVRSFKQCFFEFRSGCQQ